MKIPYKALLALCLILAAGPSYALCTAGTTSVNFGAYDVFQTAQTNSTGSITITCDKTTNNVVVNIGTSSYSGVFSPRQMEKAGASELLNYKLFTDPARLNVWGDGTLGTSNFTGQVRKNFPAILIVYGSIPAGQDVSAGLYSDVLTVTVLP